MKIKLLLLAASLIILTVAIWAAVGNVRTQSQAQQKQLADLEKAPDRGTINWHVRVAKAKGVKRISLPVRIADYASGVKDLDEALTYNGLVLAEPLEMKSVIVNDTGILTWYKFRIIENLTNKPLPQCSSCAPTDLVIPQGLSELSQGEIFIPEPGGEVEVDGIRLVYQDSKFSPFEIAKKYLLLLQTDSSGRIGLITMGPTGVYTLDDYDRLESMDKSPHHLKFEINDRFNSSIKSLKNHLQNKSK